MILPVHPVRAAEHDYVSDYGFGSNHDVRGIARTLASYGNTIGVARGDNWLSIRPLIAAGIDMYDPLTREKLTGMENKKRASSEDNTPGQPHRIYFDRECKGSFASGMPPQNFPERLKGGVLKIAIGAGYDLMMNDALESGDVAIHLNGKMNDPATRGQHMVRDLANAGYAAVNLGVKPVVFPLITPRRQKGYAGNVIRRFEDLRGSGDVKAMSEIHRIFRRYLEEKGIPFSSVSGAHGGADGEAIANLWDLVADLAETGNELVRWAKYVDMVEDAQGKPCFVTYSQPHLVVPQRVFDSDKPFFDELFALTQEAVDFLKVKEPALFDEKYLGLPGRFRERERVLMEEGIIDREGHLLEAMA